MVKIIRQKKFRNGFAVFEIEVISMMIMMCG